jgi:formate hydrogenlyase subunit 3/multisubunit Na+/H+ antiporter MnhD subunit
VYECRNGYGCGVSSLEASELLGRTPGRARWVELLGRAGLIAKGVSYGLVGVLALELALGEGGRATSRQGALATIASHGWGKALLLLLAAGFAAYALWRLADTIWPDEDDDGAKQLAKRVGSLGRAAIYAGLTYSALKIAFGSGGEESQTAKAHKATAHVLGWPGGTWIVGLAGACIIAAGAYNVYRGVTKKFAKRWETTAGEIPKWGERAGVAGLLARGVVFGLIGAFFIKSAVEYDPSEAVGFDGALQKLAHEAYGEILLGVTAAGLLAYAIFCLVEARYRRI